MELRLFNVYATGVVKKNISKKVFQKIGDLEIMTLPLQQFFIIR